MGRLHMWFWAAVGVLVGWQFGILKGETAADSIYFGGVYLLGHWIFNAGETE